jgi:hypothetical protein
VTAIPARILKGWLALGRKTGLLLAIITGCAAAAAAIALPLWYTATAHPAAYSVAAVALLAAAAIATTVRSALRARRLPRDPTRPRRTLATVLYSAAVVLLLAAGLYGVVLLAVRGILAGAVPAAVAWLALAGWAGFGRRPGRSR